MNKFKFILLFITVSTLVFSQEAPNTEYVRINGEWAPAIIEDGDTLILLELNEITFSAPRNFKDKEEEAKYNKYKRYAVIVYPYAVKAIKIFAETDYVTRNMKNKQRRKHIKRLQKELKEEFEDPLKKLTKLQGYILTKMIEKEREASMYDLIKDLKNGLSARYWQTMGSFFNYDLKSQYQVGDDPILDMILEDLDVSYELPCEL
jgi:hypothetical protein